MSTPRHRHSATPLRDGRVVVIGGAVTGGTADTVEVWSPSTNAFAEAGRLRAARFDHTATLLRDGCVAVSGGNFFEVPDGGNGGDAVREAVSLDERWCP